MWVAGQIGKESKQLSIIEVAERKLELPPLHFSVVHIQKGEITESDMYAIASVVGISDKCNHTKRPKMKTGFLDAMLFL